MSALEARDNQPGLAAIEVVEVGDLLASLVEKSLLYTDGQRLWMLETVRAYGRASLADCGEADAIRARHLGYLLSLAEDAETHLLGPEQQQWLDRLEAEHDNLRIALDWAVEQRAGEGLRLAGAIGRFWEIRGHVGEGRRALAGLLEATSRGSVRPEDRARALNFAGILAYRGGDYPAARKHHEESLEIRRSLADVRGTATSLNNLGIAAVELADFSTAQAHYEESLAIWRELGDLRGIAATLNNLGFVARVQGDYATARAMQEESLQIQRQRGDRTGIAYLLNNLGNVVHAQGEYETARALHQESLEIRRELGDRWGTAMSLCNLGNVEFELGRHAAARALYEEGLATYRGVEARSGMAEALTYLGSLALATGEVAAARSYLEEALWLGLELGERWGVAGALAVYGAVIAQLDGPEPPHDCGARRSGCGARSAAE